MEGRKGKKGRAGYEREGDPVSGECAKCVVCSWMAIISVLGVLGDPLASKIRNREVDPTQPLRCASARHSGQVPIGHSQSPKPKANANEAPRRPALASILDRWHWHRPSLV